MLGWSAGALRGEEIAEPKAETATYEQEILVSATRRVEDAADVAAAARAMRLSTVGRRCCT